MHVCANMMAERWPTSAWLTWLLPDMATPAPNTAMLLSKSTRPLTSILEERRLVPPPLLLVNVLLP